ncbi:MAG: flagellar biosynthesis protein FlhF [Planctomycetes bacterium]|nr:flagellar biosynthesis protein FlhF [Planctomycetota bacterium]
MKPRIYQADTMAGALAKVKRDLGQRAVILRTRTVKSGGLFGVGARNRVEITAGEEMPYLPAQPTGEVAPARSAVAAPIPARVTGPIAEAPVPQPPVPAAFQRELQDIKSLVQRLVQTQSRDSLSHLHPQLHQAYTRLIQNEVAEELAADFIGRINDRQTDGRPLDPATINEFLVQQFARVMAPGAPIQLTRKQGRATVVALVGATGVGKTTTIAKLAAQFRLKQGCRVGLVTIDTYRIAATEQLRTYAEIIDAPLEVVLTPQDMKPALERLRDCDIVLIDTAGRSQFDREKLNELGEFLSAAEPDETHLVLSATSSHAVLMKAMEEFSSLKIDRVIFTKLDEAVGIGTLLAVCRKLDAKLSYVTTGQDVPSDIEESDGRKLAEMIVGGARAGNN